MDDLTVQDPSMDDPIYNIPEHPVYDPKIRALKTSDPANAEAVFNPLLSKIITNIHALKLAIEQGEDAGHLIELSSADVPASGTKTHLKILHAVDNWVTPQYGAPAPVEAALFTDSGETVKGAVLLDGGGASEMFIISESESGYL